MYFSVKKVFDALIYLNDQLLWGYVGLPLIFGSIVYLSFKSRFLQLTKLPSIFRYFLSCRKDKNTCELGTSPIRVFYAMLGGSIGIGNLASVGTAVQVGGPGALFWVCAVSFMGSVIKYSEVYLGLKFRVKNARNAYDGGPMYYLQHAFPQFRRWLPKLVCILLCLYGVDIYIFTVIKSSFSNNFNLPTGVCTVGLLGLLVLGFLGGVNRIGRIGQLLLPPFLLIYTSMGVWVCFQNGSLFPQVLKSIFSSAFTGHAALGGFAGSSVLLTISKGFSTSAYTSDFGVGYASVIQSETAASDCRKEASLSVLGIFINTFIVCLCSMLLVLITGVWASSPVEDGGMLVQKALSNSFSNMRLFMPFFLLILGYTCLLCSFMCGVKCARFISPSKGALIYYAYALCMFIMFSYFDTYYALIIMTLVGGTLTVINVLGILKLRNEIDYDI